MESEPKIVNFTLVIQREITSSGILNERLGTINEVAAVSRYSTDAHSAPLLYRSFGL